jgi:internalin A
MEDKLYLNAITEQSLNNLDEIINNYRTLYIVNSLCDETLQKVNDTLSTHNIPLLLEIDSNRAGYNACTDLNVLRSLSNLKKLRIFVTDGEVNTLSALANINDLEVLRLERNFKKNISLDVLNKFQNLKALQLDNGLSAKQATFINKLKNLETLQVSDLDLSQIEPNPNVTSIRIRRKLSNADLIKGIFPVLKHIYLERCNDVNIASSIAQLPNLESIWLRYMNRVVGIPAFANIENVKLFQTTALSKLNDISNLFNMKNLQALMATDLEFLSADDFVKLVELKRLEVAYVTFKNAKENEKFFDFCKKHNFIYKQPALVDDKFDA